MNVRIFSIVLIQLCGVAWLSGEEREVTKVNATEVGRKFVVQGQLGLPVGTIVTIRGDMVQNGPFLELAVDTVDGKKLRGVVMLSVPETEDLAPGTRVVATGHEQGTLRFVTAEDTNVSPAEARRFVPHQHLFLTFVVSKKLRIEGP